LKILVIEDEADLRETIVSFLEEEGYHCEQASNKVQGSEKLNLYEYDCILVDAGMPDGNGLSLIRVCL
jgi:DNA-binding response OmpR family regulator